jgi:hypothetical protein
MKIYYGPTLLILLGIGYGEAMEERESYEISNLLGRYLTLDLRSTIPTSSLYKGNDTEEHHFIPVRATSEGCSIATIYHLGQDTTDWIGKVAAAGDI